MKSTVLLFFSLLALPAWARQSTEDPFPFFDYWPVILLPIFGILVWQWWKRSKQK